jgi:hypothetical protein
VLTKIELKTVSEIMVPISNENTDFFWEITRRKILNSYLTIIIMKRMEEIGFTSPSEMTEIIEGTYDIRISPGVIYQNFNKLKTNQYIINLPEKTNRLYVLTKKGKKQLSGLNLYSRKYKQKRQIHSTC